MPDTRRRLAAILVADTVGYSRLMEANEDLTHAWMMSSCTRGDVGDTATAVRHAEQGVRLSPLDARLFWHEGVLAQTYYLQGDYDSALDWIRSAWARNESRRANLRTLIATLVAQGQTDDAQEAARIVLRLEPKLRPGSYAQRCPFPTGPLETWLERLKIAGLSE